MRKRVLRFVVLLLVAAIVPGCLNAIAVAAIDGRVQVPLAGNGWQFFGATDTETLPDIDSPAYKSAAWSSVAVPHTFNSRQAYDTLSQAWYRREVNIGPELQDKRFFLVFEGVTSVADVYVNGKHLGQHRGAYTRFLFDATTALHSGENEIAVRVDNRVSEIHDLFPNKTRLFKLWGGINRKVWLLATDPLHIDPTDYASPGVYITPSDVTAASAKLKVEVLLRDDDTGEKKAQVRATLLDPANKPVKVLTADATVEPGTRQSVVVEGDVDAPLLWEPGHPSLYHVKVDVLSDGRVVDEVTQPTGFRTVDFQFKENKVFVNGKRIKFFGADLHEETEDKGNALSDDDIRANFDVMRDLGVNFMRLPHYPHAELEYDLCDERGIFCWPENGHTNDEKFRDDKYPDTGATITTEMVKQNYNHPSIALWSVGNEARPPASEDAVPLVRTLDPSRPVVVANMHCAPCDLEAINTYPGWYGKFGFRDYTPTGFITENGGGGVVTIHTDYDKADYKVDSYEPEEYQQLVAENDMSKAVGPSNDNLAMYLWWTLREFSDHKYKQPVGINSKGLLTYAGDKKDVYYLYRSYLRPDVPTVHITSKRYFLRRGEVNNGIKVYSNAKNLTLTLNGELVSTLENGNYTQPGGPYLGRTEPPKDPSPQKIDNVFYWPVPLHTGKNLVSVTDGLGDSDSATVYFYGEDGLPGITPARPPLVTELTSSAATNPAYFMDMPVEAEWPIYYDLDSSADNSWHKLPAEIEGSKWIALHRVTKDGEATTVSFKLTRAATVYVAASNITKDTEASFLRDAKFTLVGDGFNWRNNDLLLVPAHLYERKAQAGDTISVTLGQTDAVVLVKE